MSGPIVLGLETSCDETSAGVLRGDSDLLGHVVLSQDAHRVYGGVVPEIAARAHLRRVDAVVDAALDEAGLRAHDLDAVGVTVGPGLIGALLVGVTWAKAFAYAIDRPLVGVHHMEGHLFAASIEDPDARPPFVALLVSGGHTLLLHAREWGAYRLLGETRDDAAGEAFDKVGKLLGLPYPGGPRVEARAREGDPRRYTFPRPMLRRDLPADDGYYDFSFSGLKTAVATAVARLEETGEIESERAHVAAAFQEAAVEVLVEKTMRAVEVTGCRRVLLGGGVSANRYLRERLSRRIGPDGSLFVASTRLSVDNGAMIARAASFRFTRGDLAGDEISGSATLPLPGLA